MATTIQISKKTKKKLFMVINRLEKQLGRRVTYDEAINFLVKEERVDLNKLDFIKHIKKYQGILKPGEGKRLLRELRKIDYERERKIK